MRKTFAAFEIGMTPGTIGNSAPAAFAVDTKSRYASTEKNNCVACHTPALVGQQHIPRLAGQHKVYLLEQLKGFKAGTRADIDGTMTSAAQGLALDELELVADYLSALQAP